jgi:general secretion pathway protein B
MSYILDALKRSEQERHQDKMPSFSAENMIIQSNQKKSHWWPYALIVVLILNAVVLFFFNQSSLNEPELKTKTEPLNTKTSVQIKKPESSLVVSSSSQRRAPPASVVKERQYIQPLKQTPQNHISNKWQQSKNTKKLNDDHLYGTIVDEGLLIKPKANASQQIKPPSAGFTNEANTFGAPIQINPSYTHKENVNISPSPTERIKSEARISSDTFIEVPLLTELALNFQKNIPKLTFNSHIYSDKPSERRVMINNYYLKEGQSFDGIQLIVIGEAFIKVSKGGTIFKLPVLRDWTGL